MGGPDAPASSIRLGAAPTAQRVSAALGTGSASSRSRNRVTPDCSAARASRLLAVRSSAGHCPRHSTIRADRPGQRAASAAAFSNALVSGATPRTSESGSPPSSTRPGPWSRPPNRSALSVRSQKIGERRPTILSASMAAKPEALAASSPLAANSSCTRPRVKPPPSASSNAAQPVAIRSSPDSSLPLAIKAMFRLSMTR